MIEWNFEEYEGLMPQQINEVAPGWLTFLDGCPGGETPEQVGERVDRVIARAPMVERDVALFAHGHVLRVLAARYLCLEPTAGRMFRLDTGTVSTLGTEHAEPVIMSWNVPPLA